MKKGLLVLLVLYSFMSTAQEGQFSQYFASTSFVNPAFPGTMPSMNFSANYKRSGAPEEESYLELMQGTFTYPLKKETSEVHQYGSIGGNFFKESRGFRGVYRVQKALINGTYSLDLSDLRNQMLVFGLQGGLVQHDINSDAFRWGSQFNQFFGYDNSLDGESIQNQRLVYPVFNAGVIYTTYDHLDQDIRSYSFTTGLSVDNINQPNVSAIGTQEVKKAMLVKAFGTFQFPLGARFYGHPSAYVLNSQGSFQYNMGMYVSTFVSSARSNLAVMIQTGGWYRLNDSFIAMLGFRFDNIQVGLSVDLNASDQALREDLGGNLPAYEISLSYNFDLKKQSRRISSPIF